MEFQNLIEKRRTVRKYAAGNSVSKEDVLAMVKAAQEAPSWKNSQTGRYYCIMNEKDVARFREKCLPEMNAGKCENAVLIVSTFVHNRAGFQRDGSADNELGNGWGCYDLGLQNENLVLKATELLTLELAKNSSSDSLTIPMFVDVSTKPSMLPLIFCMPDIRI